MHQFGIPGRTNILAWDRLSVTGSLSQATIIPLRFRLSYSESSGKDCIVGNAANATLVIIHHKAGPEKRSTNGSIHQDYGRQFQARSAFRCGHIFNLTRCSALATVQK